LLTSKEAGHDY